MSGLGAETEKKVNFKKTGPKMNCTNVSFRLDFTKKQAVNSHQTKAKKGSYYVSIVMGIEEISKTRSPF